MSVLGGATVDGGCMRKRRVQGSIICYAAIAFVFLAIGPWVFSSDWVSSSDFHACIEICSAFVAIIAAVACLMYFFGLKSRYFLIVGLGFFVCGGEDFIHGILGFSRIFEGTGVDFSRFIPGTYVAGRASLAVMIAAAVLLEYRLGTVVNAKREAVTFSAFAVALGGGATALAFGLALPRFMYPQRAVSRPVDFISSMLFVVAFLLTFKRYLYSRDTFSGALLACILLNIGGQVYMSFSKQLYDIFFDVAHWANILSYCMPVLGIAIQGLEEIKKSNHEIVERKRAEKALARKAQELTRSNADLEQFAYVASHDLQEPLRMVSSYVQLLARRYRGKLDADADEFIYYAVDGAKRMKALIDSLLRYSRVRTGGKPFERTDSGEVVGEVLANLRLAIEESGACVTCDPLPIVTADPTQLGQVFQNLVGNALKFRGDGQTKVHIAAERGDGEWIFSVQDNGIGFDPQYSDRLFRVFERLHSRAEYAGTGIGLAICKSVAERHGGRVWADSEPDKGSTFYFTIAMNGEGQP